MEALALLTMLIAVGAVVCFVVEATRPPKLHVGWAGLVLLSISLIVWHTVANLPLVFR